MAKSATGLTCDVVPADALSPADTSAWRDVQALTPAFRNPLFGPAFAAAVGRVRSDAHVAVYRRDTCAVAFLAHHRRPGGFGRPIGAPFADYHGLVSSPDEPLDAETALRLAQLGAFRHNGLVDPLQVFPAPVAGHAAYAIELTDGADAYLEGLRAASPKKFKNYRRLQSRLAEMGPLQLRVDSSQADFDQLLAWKRAQFIRTGVQDVLRPPWARQLMQSLFDLRSDALSGLMLTLHAGDRLVAGHFGMRDGEIYHPWIASTDPELAAYSPGQIFFDQVIRAMPEVGLRVYDLGPGSDHYKRPFASTVTEVSGGLTVTSGASGRLFSAGERSWTMGGLGRSTALDKVRRRLDHIASSDPSMRGRLHGVMEAAKAARTRSLGADGAAAD